MTGDGGSRATSEPPILATPELDLAMAQFVSAALDARMAEDPLLARMSRLPLPEGVAGVSVEIDQTAVASPSVPMSHSDSVVTNDLVQGNIEELHRVVIEMANSFLDQYLPTVFQHIETAVSAVGNNLNLSGEDFAWDRILDAFQMVEWQVDDWGNVRPPQMIAGAAVAAKLSALPDRTPDQDTRLIEMWTRKQEEHVSRRRSRRLRHEPNGA